MLIQAVCDYAFHSDPHRESEKATHNSFRLYHTTIKFHQDVDPSTIIVKWHNDESLSIIVDKAYQKNKEGKMVIPEWTAITESADIKPIWREMQDKWPEMI